MFVTAYLLILAWQKIMVMLHQHRNNKAVAVTAHDVSADLPNAQNATVASDLPQANVTASQTTEHNTSVSQQLISVQTDLYHQWINPKVVILSVLNC